MRESCDTLDYNGLKISLIKETLSDGSKAYSVGIKGEYVKDCMDEADAIAMFLKLKEVFEKE